MFCVNCGYAIQAEAKFCPACGTPTSANAAPVETKQARKGFNWLLMITVLIALAFLLILIRSCAAKQAPVAETAQPNRIYAVGNATGVEAALADMAKQINQRIPLRIDSKTVITGAEATGKSLRTVLNIDHPYPREQVLAMLEANMPAYIRANYCTQPSQLKLLKDGAIILLEFRNRDGSELYATVPVTLNQCG